MIDVAKFYSCLTDNGIDFFTGVPDSLLKNICAYITDNAPSADHIIAANEGAAVAIGAGHHLATGHMSLVYMQNSGIGNAVNPLLSLNDEKVYSIPCLLMIGWRGEPGIKDEPQHKKQGEVTISLLEAMGIPYHILSSDEDEALSQTREMIGLAKDLHRPCAVVIRKDTFGKYKLRTQVPNDYPMSREEALKIVVDALPVDALVVSTTGKLSRELFEHREARNAGHQSDFLTVGSMGHSSSIALGIALAKPGRKVFCLDGDGAVIMHTGALATVGSMAPRNFFHIVFNNGAHESVGGQPTVGMKINLAEVAKSMGYHRTLVVESEHQLRNALENLIDEDGPLFLEVRVKVSSRDDLGRPTTTPIENRDAFMENIRNN